MLLVIIVGAGWASHWIRKNIMVEYRNRPIGQATGNAMQISLALQEFDKDYGSFPSVSTIADVKNATGTDFSLGHTTSNDFFRQLLAAGHGNEGTYYARIHGSGSKRPDEITSGGRALEKGECGFSYIPGISGSSSIKVPILITPLIPGTDRVDPGPFGGDSIVVYPDGTFYPGTTDKHGHLLIGGMRLLDPANPIWNGNPPTLVWPE